MPHLIILILVLLSPILLLALALLFVLVCLFGRPAKYPYYHSICREDGE